MRIALRSFFILTFFALGVVPVSRAQDFILGVTTASEFFIMNAQAPAIPILPPTLITGLGVRAMDIAVQSRFTGTTSVKELSAMPDVDVTQTPRAKRFSFARRVVAPRAILTDLQGRTAMSMEGTLSTVSSLPLASLPAGTYALRLQNSGKISGAVKVVKQ